MLYLDAIPGNTRVDLLFYFIVSHHLTNLTRSFSQHLTRLWKVFFDDKDRPNRYILAKEMISRPDSEDIDVSIVMK